MINVNGRWAFKVDENNNHMPHIRKTIKPKKEGEVPYEKLVHTGNYFKNLELTLGFMVDYDLREETDGKELNIEEYLDTYQRISLELTNNFNDRKEK